MISTQQKKLLELLARAIHDQPAEFLNAEKWNAFFQVYQDQTVWALPMAIIDTILQDEKQKKLYQDTVATNVLDVYKILAEQKTVIDLLETEKIPVVILKGAAAAMYYSHPEYRCMGDVDLLVKPDDFVRAFELLCNHGYEHEETPEEYYRHIHFVSPFGVTIELHSSFSSSSHEEENQILDAMIYEGVDHCEKIKVCGSVVPVLPAPVNGIVLLGHLNHHLSSGLGLRQIVDWLCFVEKELDDDLWYSDFQKRAEKIGMKKLAVITTAMCQKYLGLQSTLTWCGRLSEEEEKLADQLMEYILSKGNFGRNDLVDSMSVSVIRAFRNPIQGLKKAQQTGKDRWTLLEKYPRLKAFAWLYQIFRWIGLGLRRGVTFRKFSHSVETEKKDTQMLEQLEVTRLKK